MARFLTPEWLDDLGAILESASLAGEARLDSGLALRQVVTGGPDGDTSYVVRIDENGVSLDLDPRADADIEVRHDLGTATEIATGRLSPSAAFAAGRTKLTGKVGLLVENQGVLSNLGDLFGHLRTSTTY